MTGDLIPTPGFAPAQPRPWPSKDAVRQHHKARTLADDKIGMWLTMALDNPAALIAVLQTRPFDIQRDIQFWLEFYPECRH